MSNELRGPLRHRRTLLAAAGVAVALVLSGCVTTYQPLGYGAGGYSDSELSKTQYYVFFAANSNTPQTTAYKFFLTRAAQIALDRGYTGFYVFSLKNQSQTQTYVVPGTARTYYYRNVVPEYENINGVGFLTTRVYRHRVTIYNPPQYYSVSEPGYGGRILLTNEQLKGQPAPFNARMVYNEGMALKKEIDNHNRVIGLAAGLGTAIVIGVSVATAALAPSYVYVGP